MRSRTALVVGSGCSGLMLAALLAKSGQEVVLVESQSRPGGYLRRFVRDQMYWDTGYHFTGGSDGLMPQLLALLDAPECRFTALDHRIFIPEAGIDMILPGNCGFDGCMASFAAAFPKEKDQLSRYLAIEKSVWESTPFNTLLCIPQQELELSDWDFKTVSQTAGECGLSPEAQAAVNSFAMCHGSLPQEVPMSFHSRVSYLMHTGLARQEDGGDAIIAGFMKTAEKYGIRLLCNTRIAEIRAVNGDCREAVLTNGEVLATSGIYFTIHPAAAIPLLPQECLTPSIRRRWKRMTESCSFITAYFNVDDQVQFTPQLADRFTGTDLNQMLLAADPAVYATGIMLHKERDFTGRIRNAVTAFRTAASGTPAGFPANHRDRLLSAEYQAYKAQKTAEIAADISAVFPEFAGHLHPVESGTPLTNLTWQPPTGSAYGVRCICGQTRISGNIPGTNCFFAGQSSLVPGVMGAMLSSVSLFYQLAGEKTYREILRQTGI